MLTPLGSSIQFFLTYELLYGCPYITCRPDTFFSVVVSLVSSVHNTFLPAEALYQDFPHSHSAK